MRRLKDGGEQAVRKSLGLPASGSVSAPNRFRYIWPDATPWRERQMSDAMVQGLVHIGATDAEAADIFAAECERLRADAVRRAEPSKGPAGMYRAPRVRDPQQSYAGIGDDREEPK